jgi:proline dehydrogenase
VRTDLQKALVAKGHPLRIYLPFGSQWYPYLTRRLAERPANAWFFARSIFSP